MWKRNGVALMGLLTLSACATKPLKAPDALMPPTGSVMVMESLGAGTQPYVCQVGEQGALHWVAGNTEMDLFDTDGTRVARRLGSRWVMNDGSQVGATVQTTVPAAKEGSLPWALWVANEASGQGKLAHVQWVQELNTHGGSAPDAGACSKPGKTDKVLYTATYRFFVAR